jgi:hypothetical protein
VELESVKDPVFLLDRQEPWRPVSVEDALQLAGLPAAERAQFLAGEWPEAYLNFPADMAPPATPVVGYRPARKGWVGRARGRLGSGSGRVREA